MRRTQWLRTYHSSAWRSHVRKRTHQLAAMRVAKTNWLTHHTVINFKPNLGPEPSMTPFAHPTADRKAPPSWISSLARFHTAELGAAGPFPFNDAYSCCSAGWTPDSETKKGKQMDVETLTSDWKKSARAPDRTASDSTASGTEDL
jgi:hypothetical protein